MQNTCIEISVRRIGGILSIGSERLGEGMSFRTEREGRAMEVEAARASSMLSFGSERIGTPLEFRCGLVCTVGQARYLKVEPQTVWLLPENAFSADVVVYSNVTWRIE